MTGPFQWHRKPPGWSSAPCPICGCETPRLRARHRALTSDEQHRLKAFYVKALQVAYGRDTSVEILY